MEEEVKYYERVYEDVIDGVKIKFRKLNPMEHLGLCTDTQTWAKVNGTNFTEMYKKIFINILFTKNDVDWIPLIDTEGNSRLKELEDNISACMDLYFEYKQKVIDPVFSESKTFHNTTATKRK